VNRVKRRKMLWLLIPIILSLAIIPARSQIIRTWLYVYPENAWATPGNTFEVAIMVNYITPTMALWAYQVELEFDPTIIQGVSIRDGKFMGSKGGQSVLIEGAGFDNTNGELALCGAYLDPISKFPYGRDGDLLIVTFEVIAEGTCDITFGPDCALINSVGRTIPMRDPIPGFVIGYPAPDELYIRTKGAHGGGVWPDWHVGAIGDMQTLNARINNLGPVGADVKVLFHVVAPGMPVFEFWSNEAWIDPRVGDTGTPGEVVVSATFQVEIPGEYTVSGMLYFKAAPLDEFVYYGLYEGFAGIGDTRDIATKFKAELTHP
jgi:hypothetical protein